MVCLSSRCSSTSCADGLVRIRASYVTAEHPSLSPALFDPASPLPSPGSAVPPITHLSREDLVPSLTSEDIDQINATLMKYRRTVPDPELRTRVESTKDTRFKAVSLPAESSAPLRRSCFSCER